MILLQGNSLLCSLLELIEVNRSSAESIGLGRSCAVQGGAVEEQLALQCAVCGAVCSVRCSVQCAVCSSRSCSNLCSGLGLPGPWRAAGLGAPWSGGMHSAQCTSHSAELYTVQWEVHLQLHFRQEYHLFSIPL